MLAKFRHANRYNKWKSQVLRKQSLTLITKHRGQYIAVVVRRMCMHIHTIWYVMASILPYNSLIVAIGYGWQMEI